MKIKFYIPDDERIPAALRLKVDDSIDVYYKRDSANFAYTFSFLPVIQNVNLDIATAIVDEIVSTMVSQSYDHGAQWRERGVREIKNDEYELSITVYFRLRDSY